MKKELKADKLIQLFKNDEPRLASPVRQLLGIIWANLKILLAYKSWLIMDLLSTVASVVMYYFVGLQVDPQRLVQTGWGTSYLAFSLIGVATSHYLWSCLTRLSHSIQHEIRGGTLETVAVTPVNMFVFFIGLTARGYLVSSIYLIGVFAVGIVGLGVRFILTAQSVATALLSFALMLIANQALGLIAAGIVMVHKRGDPVTFIVAAMNEFLAGVLYPLEMLKAFPILQGLSMMLPYAYALDAMRRSLMFGVSLADQNVFSDLSILFGSTVILVPLGLAVLQWGYRTIRRQGTTSSY